MCLRISLVYNRLHRFIPNPKHSISVQSLESDLNGCQPGSDVAVRLSSHRKLYAAPSLMSEAKHSTSSFKIRTSTQLCRLIMGEHNTTFNLQFESNLALLSSPCIGIVISTPASDSSSTSTPVSSTSISH